MKNFTLRKVFFLIAIIQIARVNAQNSPVNCNGQFYVSHGSSNTSTSTTNVEQLSFSGSTINPSSFSLNPGGIGFNAMGINPIDGYIYAIRYPASSSVQAHLIRIGSGGTNLTDLGAISGMNNGEIAYAGCFDFDGTFYFATASNRLMKISNPVSSLNATQVGSNISVSPFLADIAINPIDGQMYGTSTGSSNFLYTINKNTGVVSAGIGSSMGSGYFASLFFTEDGTLYGYRSDGAFYQINKSNASLTASGSGPSYTYADGCSCSFRVGHTMQGASFCPTGQTPNPNKSVAVTISNSSGIARTGLTYTLDISDPKKRLRFTQSAATIAQNLFTAGLLPDNSASHVTLSTMLPASGTNYNKIVVTGFQAPFGQSSYSFQLSIQLYTLGGTYDPVSVQSIISGLPAGLGGTDLSGNGIQPHGTTQLDFCSGITLPVKLVSFKANLENNVAKLTWESAVEENIAGYFVQRSYNGNDFTDVGFVTAAGKANAYNYNDALVNNPEKIYYRLKIQETLGYSYSGIVVLESSASLGSIKVTPNPFRKEIQLSITSPEVRNITYSLLSIEGKQLRTASQKLSRGSNVFFMNDLESLQTGIYFLQVQYNGEMKTIKLLKTDR